MNYKYITQAERHQIYALNKAGISQAKIAYQLNRDPSTISRELKPNNGLKGYRPKKAQLKAVTRNAIKFHNRLGGWYDINYMRNGVLNRLVTMSALVMNRFINGCAEINLSVETCGSGYVVRKRIESVRVKWIGGVI